MEIVDTTLPRELGYGYKPICYNWDIKILEQVKKALEFQRDWINGTIKRTL